MNNDLLAYDEQDIRDILRYTFDHASPPHTHQVGGGGGATSLAPRDDHRHELHSLVATIVCELVSNMRVLIDRVDELEKELDR